jgi:hypothetical protein
VREVNKADPVAITRAFATLQVTDRKVQARQSTFGNSRRDVNAISLINNESEATVI